MKILLSLTSNLVSPDEAKEYFDLGFTVGEEFTYSNGKKGIELASPLPIEVNSLEELSDLINKAGVSCVIGNTSKGDMWLEIYNDYRE